MLHSFSSPPKRAPDRQRWLRAGIAATVAGVLAYGISAVVARAWCADGACPVGEAPWPFILLLAAVAGASVAWGSDPRS